MSVIPKIDNKRVFSPLPENAQQYWDAIVIGSGIGGMSCAAALSNCCDRVLVLEQHYLPGGFTQMFSRHGFQWDSGVHIVGEMAEDNMMGKLLNWLTDNQIVMESTGSPYEKFSYSDGMSYNISSNTDEYIFYLKQLFPADASKIDKYFRLVKKVQKRSKLFFGGKLLSQKLDKFVQKLYIGKNYWNIKTADVFTHLGISGRLRSLLSGQWGYYGNKPDTSSFAIHALTQCHFGNGAYYPRGGSVSYARGLISQIVKAGGAVYTKAEVSKLLIDGKKVKGVELSGGNKFYAAKVISAIGAKNTALELLPQRYKSSQWAKALSRLKESVPYICLYLGFNGDIESAGASRSNWWLIEDENRRSLTWNSSDFNERPDTLYLSFPSLKDPDHEPGENLKHTGECVTFISWDILEQWKNSTKGSRPEDYTKWKKTTEMRIINELKAKVPEIMKHMTYCEMSSPLSTVHYTKAYHGGIYSLEATPDRFSTGELRPRTPIKGFYLTGVDIAGVGVDSAMIGGMLTAAVIHPRLVSHLI